MKQIKKIPVIPLRKNDSHKGHYGKVLIIGGCLGMSGAPALAGKAALKTGSGLVRLAIPKSILTIVACLEPCYTTIPLTEDADGKIDKKAITQILNAITDVDAVAFGTGIGLSNSIKNILAEIIDIDNLKIIIDADGLNNLAKISNWPNFAKAKIILTPHLGEMEKIWRSVFRTNMPDDRLKTATELAKHTNTTVILKGHKTIVCNNETYYINTTGNPGMATAGCGDVLTGMVVSFVGQGFSLFDSAVLGAYHHGRTGDEIAKLNGQASTTAINIVERIRIP